MSHLGFGKKLVHGAPDVGSLLPAGTRDCNRSDLRASSAAEALGHDSSTHDGIVGNPCGDLQRSLTIHLLEQENHAQSEHGADKTGWPSFTHWPRWNDITHQQMWVDWIRRAYEGGMRVMVALATNNRTLATTIHGDGPLDDVGSANLQIA